MADSTRPSEQSPESVGESLKKQKKQEYDRKRYAANRDKLLLRSKAYRAANLEEVRKSDRRRYLSDLTKRRATNQQSAKRNRAKNSAREREWRKKNTEKVRGYYRKSVKKKYAKDDLFKLQQNMRTRISAVLSRSGSSKNCRTMDLVGCTASELRAHIEGKFLPGMTWSNKGHDGWHIDHIVPLSRFDLTDHEQQAAAFHYTNLQPLWAEDNLRKSDKLPGQYLFGFAYAANIALGDPQPRRKKAKDGGKHSDDLHADVPC